MNAKSPFQFGLSTMLLITAIAAVLMSISVMLPPLGIALAVLSVPASIRSYALVLKYRKAHYPIAVREQALLFVSCLSISWLIMVAAAGAFIVGFVLCGIVSGLLGGLVGGTIAGLIVFAMLLRRWFKYPATAPGDWKSRRTRCGEDRALGVDP
jgi:hypothetical protein